MPSNPDQGPVPSAAGETADPALTVLRDRFGLDSFRPGQEEVVRAVLAGRPALAVFPTGSGKSLCFQLPALMLEGLTLVVSPLVALMADQVNSLTARSLPAARLDSTLSEEESAAVLGLLAGGGLKLLYVSPERLSSTGFLSQLRGVKVALLAVDEAHCISEWGHNFRPDYLKLAKLRRTIKAERVLALTATATPAVARDIRKAFRITGTGHFHHPTPRNNLRLGVTACADGEKNTVLLRLLKENPGSAIVYATTRRQTENLCAMLQKLGHSARLYHGGCSPAERAAAQEAFLSGRARIMVATIAFGMGIDKPDVRTVIHHNLPKCLEGYSQEIGRAGRDGLPARCEILADLADTRTLENFIHGSTPAEDALRALLDRVLRLAGPGGKFTLAPYDLSVAHDMRPETVATALAYLELAGVIERAGTFYDHLRILSPRPLEQILAGREYAERRVIRTLFAAAEPDRRGLHLQLSQVTGQTGLSQKKIVGTLTGLADAGEIRLDRRGLRAVFRVSRKWDGNRGAVIGPIARRFAELARRDEERIADVVGFIRSRRCRVVSLAAYFGQRWIKPCGVCDRCQGAAPLRLAKPRRPAIPADEWARMRSLRDEGHPALATPRSLARFLCGIPSPAAAHARLNSRPEFGMWHAHPFHEVLAMLEA